jgi:hypothetical protein
VIAILDYCIYNKFELRQGEAAIMPKTSNNVHWPDASDLWMPYAPAIKVSGGTTVYRAGVTAAPGYPCRFRRRSSARSGCEPPWRHAASRCRGLILRNFAAALSLVRSKSYCA